MFEFFRARVPLPATGGRVYYRIALPAEIDWQRSFFAFLLSLCEPQAWAAGDWAGREAALLEAQNIVGSFEPVDNIGQLVFFVGNPPTGVLPMDGSVHLRSEYPRLWDQIPASWKDSFGETFVLPDMSDRYFRGAGAVLDVGEEGGSDTFTLNIAHLPAHNHAYWGVSPTTVTAGLEVPVPAAVPSITPSATTDTGSGAPVTHIPPSLGVKVGIVAE